MSGYMGDITNYLSAGFTSAATAAKTSKASSGYDLDMQDFLTLMVTELQCQSLDATADTSDMLNQMVMMQMVSALTNMTDASIMSYAASLVGKTVTVGQYNDQGVLQEIVGEVTGTGTMGGEQVVFVDDKYYYMSQIMAVGTLPKVDGTEGTEPEVPEDSGVSGVTGNESAAPEEKDQGSKIKVPEVPDVPEVTAPEVPQVPENDLTGTEE
jgi:flagellar basal-body rod modification protein FlgD